jgi:hypothetical protein
MAFDGLGLGVQLKVADYQPQLPARPDPTQYRDPGASSAIAYSCPDKITGSLLPYNTSERVNSLDHVGSFLFLEGVLDGFGIG